jgi:hypothetical protein
MFIGYNLCIHFFLFYSSPLIDCHLLKKHDLFEEYSLIVNVPLSTQLIKVPLPTTEEEHLHGICEI